MPELKKESIINVSEALFLKDGLRLVSIEDICRTLGISKKTFYQYYSSKEELVVDVMLKKSESNRNRLRAMAEGKDVVEFFVAMSSEFSRKKTLTSMKRLYSEVAKYYPEAARKLAADKDEVILDMFTGAIAGGMEQGFVRTDIDMDACSVLVVAMHHGMLAYCEESYPANGKKVPFKSLAASFTGMVSRMFFTQKGLDRYNDLMNNK